MCFDARTYADIEKEYSEQSGGKYRLCAEQTQKKNLKTAIEIIVSAIVEVFFSLDDGSVSNDPSKSISLSYSISVVVH